MTGYDLVKETIFTEAQKISKRIEEEPINKELSGAWNALTSVMKKSALLDEFYELRKFKTEESVRNFMVSFCCSITKRLSNATWGVFTFAEESLEDKYCKINECFCGYTFSYFQEKTTFINLIPCMKKGIGEICILAATEKQEQKEFVLSSLSSDFLTYDEKYKTAVDIYNFILDQLPKKGAPMGIKEQSCCGNCIWHIHNGEDWVCTNEDSEAYGLETEYSDSCEEFSDRNS